MANPTIAVFDIGNVLIEWNPEHLYRKLIPDPAARAHFLAEVCPPAWNLAQDAGRSFAEGIAEACARHPGQAALIAAFFERWDEMVPGPIQGSVDILAALKAAGRPVHAITNFSAETFPIARRRFAFLEWFDDVVVSGAVRRVKPDPAIYRLLLDRQGLAAADTVFIDDSPANLAGARAVGMHALHFTGPDRLRADLRALDFPV